MGNSIRHDKEGTMTTYEPVQPDAIKPGDKIKATHADSGSVIYGGVSGAYLPLPVVQILVAGIYANCVAANGWSFEREVKPLILDPGVYFDRGGDLLIVDSNRWVRWPEVSPSNSEQIGMDILAPFRRAVPGEEVGR